MTLKAPLATIGTALAGLVAGWLGYDQVLWFVTGGSLDQISWIIESPGDLVFHPLLFSVSAATLGASLAVGFLLLEQLPRQDLQRRHRLIAASGAMISLIGWLTYQKVRFTDLVARSEHLSLDVIALSLNEVSLHGAGFSAAAFVLLYVGIARIRK